MKESTQVGAPNRPTRLTLAPLKNLTALKSTPPFRYRWATLQQISELRSKASFTKLQRYIPNLLTLPTVKDCPRLLKDCELLVSLKHTTQRITRRCLRRLKPAPFSKKTRRLSGSAENAVTCTSAKNPRRSVLLAIMTELITSSSAKRISLTKSSRNTGLVCRLP